MLAGQQNGDTIWVRAYYKRLYLGITRSGEIWAIYRIQLFY